MLFVTVTPNEAAHYSYICMRLKNMANKMCEARKTLEAAANASFDKTFAKCMYMLTSESLQCENEIRSHIDSMICNDNEDERHIENKRLVPVKRLSSVESVCDFFEEVYLKSYRKLLRDKKFGASLKSLIRNHLQQFTASLMQMRLFNDVKTMSY